MRDFRILCIVQLMLAGSAGELWAEESGNVPLGVTLEACGDVNAEEVQRALELEYKEGLSGTMLTVVCGDETATLRVVGPRNPQGRIVNIDLTGVTPIAVPRTIALLATELWTAPTIEVEVASTKSDNEIRRPNIKEEEDLKAEASVPSLKNLYRSGYSFGFGLNLNERTYYVMSGFGGGNTLDYLGWSLALDARIMPRVGITVEVEHGNSRSAGETNVNLPPELGRSGRQIAIYDRGEFGIYSPLMEGKWRVDMRLSAGYDKHYQPETLKVDYEYFAAGFDVAYFVRDYLMFTATGTSYSPWSGERGIRVEVGAAYQLHPFVVEAKYTGIDAEVEFRGVEYSKHISSSEIAFKYSY